MRDAFLKVAGMTGQVVDQKHLGWIDITDFKFDISREEDGVATMQERLEGAKVSNVSVTKFLDRTSPLFAKAACGNPMSFSSANVALACSGSVGSLPPSSMGLSTFMLYTFKNVAIKKYEVKAGDGYPTEDIDFGFSSLEQRYIFGNITHRWSISDNKTS